MPYGAKMTMVQKSALADEVDSDRVKPITRLLPFKNDVLELAACSGLTHAKFKQAMKSMVADLSALQGTDEGTLRAEFAAVERHESGKAPRNSMSSSDSTPAASVAPGTYCSSPSSSLASVTCHYAGIIPQRHFCPSCPADIGRRSDFSVHLRKCESTMRYECRACGAAEKSKKAMDKHVGQHGGSAAELVVYELPPKTSYGCPYCDEYFTGMQEWEDHIVLLHFRQQKVNASGSWNQRVRAAIRGAAMKAAMKDICVAGNMNETSWKAFEWPDEIAKDLVDRLEHGLKSPGDQFSYVGFTDQKEFAAELFRKRLSPRSSDETSVTSQTSHFADSRRGSSQPSLISLEMPCGPSTPASAVPYSASSAPEHRYMYPRRRDPQPAVRISHRHHGPIRHTLQDPSAISTKSVSAISHKRELSFDSGHHPDSVYRARTSPALLQDQHSSNATSPFFMPSMAHERYRADAPHASQTMPSQPAIDSAAATSIPTWTQADCGAVDASVVLPGAQVNWALPGDSSWYSACDSAFFET